MQARLIHNPRAGDAQHEASTLIAALERAGFQVRHSHFRRKKIAEWVDENVDLVVAAGGDGTICRTVRAIAGRPIPLAIAPLGTANNIARSLALEGDAATLLTRLANPIRRKLDIGIAGGSWGEHRFVEAAGVGLFQHVLEHEASAEDKAPPDARRLLLSELEAGLTPKPWELTIDGVTRTGDLLLVEIMNMNSIGPRLRFAPDAVPFDGLFDVVIAYAHDRGRLERFLRALIAGDESATPDLEIVRARHVHLRLAGSSVRIDDEVLPADGTPPSEHADFRVLSGAVELWLPG